MKKLFYLFLLISSFAFSQEITFTVDAENIKTEFNVSKTILDYGAILYNTIEEAEVGISCHVAIQNMLDEKGVAILPPYGFLNISDSVILWNERAKVLSFGHCNLVTTKPISMFLPLNINQSISGFTAWYRGNEITEECAVVRLGGDDRNIGTPIYDVDRDYQHKHFWKRRTRSLMLNLDFDMEGDQRYYTKRTRPTSKYLKSFVKGNAHAVWINFADENEHAYSYCSEAVIRGTWNWINTGIKINKRVPTQTLNTFDIDVKIWGAKKFVDIDGINFSKITFKGQEREMLGENEIVDLFSITNSNRIMLDAFVYDVGSKRVGKVENVTDLELKGFAKIHSYQLNSGETRLANTKFINCTFKN